MAYVGLPRSKRIEYRLTHLVTLRAAHAGEVADELTSHESALRKLPLPYSLALRLRDAGVAPEVISEYVGVDEIALDGVYLDLAPVALDAGADTAAAAAALFALAESRAVPAVELRGTLGADPIGLAARTGTVPDLDLLGELGVKTTA